MSIHGKLYAADGALPSILTIMAKKSSNNLESRVSALEERIQDLAEVKKDVKEVLTIVNETNLVLAKLPTWENLKETNGRVDKLEDESNSAAGGRKMLAAVAGMLGGVVGWIASYFSK
jgi:hypothetical protein